MLALSCVFTIAGERALVVAGGMVVLVVVFLLFLGGVVFLRVGDFCPRPLYEMGRTIEIPGAFLVVEPWCPKEADIIVGVASMGPVR